jgi:hypothetical protein
MKWADRIQNTAIIVAVGLLCLAFALIRIWIAIPFLVIAGSAWLWGSFLRKEWAAPFGLIVTVSACLLGLVEQRPAPLALTVIMLFSLVAAMAASDLGHFILRIQAVEKVDLVEKLEKNHLTRLGIVLGIGTLLGAAALLVQIQLNFWIAIGIGLLAIISISRMLNFYKNK